MNVSVPLLEHAELPDYLAFKHDKLVFNPNARTMKFRFEAEGIPFTAFLVSEENGWRYTLSADLGFLPFTATSSEKRAEAIALVSATAKLKTCHVTLGPYSEVRLEASRFMPGDFTMIDLFATLIPVMGEARPYLRLLSHTLA